MAKKASKVPQAAAIYTRISLDAQGEGLGVKRQEADCRARAEQLGWVVAEVYEDNDVSGYSGRQRPSYERMLADLRSGVRDGVLIYHVDRLTRQPLVLEQFLLVVQQAGVPVEFVTSGGLDIGTGDGLMIVRVQAAVAANESATKARRIERKWDERAAAGLPHAGSSRAFGFQDGNVLWDEAEAAAVRTVMERFLAGESQRSLVQWLTDQGFTTSTGAQWDTAALAYVLKSPRYAGLLVRRGEVVGRGAWEPIISEEQHRRVLAKFDERKVTNRRTARTYLLSGLVRCDSCGQKMFSAVRHNKTSTVRRYVCVSGPDHGGGCGKMTVVAGPLEELVTEAVLLRLDTAELVDALTGRADQDAEAGRIVEELAATQERIDDLAKMFGRGEIDGRAWLTAKGAAEDQRAQLQGRLARLTGTETLSGLPGNGAALREQWGDLSLSRQHAIIAALVDHVSIASGTRGARSLDPGRVDIVWRL